MGPRCHVKHKIQLSSLRIILRQRPQLLSAASGVTLILYSVIGVYSGGLDQTEHSLTPTRVVSQY